MRCNMVGNGVTTEAAVQQQIRLKSAEMGTPLLRNNVGACFDETGRLIRYGLGHDSKRLNEVFKSSDLIGINPVVITQEMVGRTIGQFMAVECKASNFKGRESDKRFVAQRNFIEWVNNHGGIGMFARSVDDVWRVK